MADQQGFSVDLMSDIHADRWKDGAFDYAAHKKSDIAIIAGDLSSDSSLSIAELRKIAAVYETVLFVDGNHEFRTGAPGAAYNFNFKSVEKALRDGIAAIPNVVYLRDAPFVKDGVAIIGRNGFWDYKLMDGVSKKEAVKDAAAEFKTTFNKAASFTQQARQDYKALRGQVIAFNRDPSIHTIVVVTHTVPRVELLNGPEKFSPAAQARMGSGKMRHLLKYDAHKKVKFWLFGHQHSPRRQEIDGVLYQENPRGRSEEGARGYRPVTLTFPAAHENRDPVEIKRKFRRRPGQQKSV